ncbi:MAG: hypothetical protein VXZ27_13780, partial [SAR324 cluster bacterium]|nr:hypothetical protein [SAR324 cluster bacterium]
MTFLNASSKSPENDRLLIKFEYDMSAEAMCRRLATPRERIRTTKSCRGAMRVERSNFVLINC